MPTYRAASGSAAEDLFIDLFVDTFGAEKAGYLYSQYLFFDIYQNSRFADFVLENDPRRIAFEIDDHVPALISPLVRIGQQKVDRKAKINRSSGFHLVRALVFAPLITLDGCPTLFPPGGTQ